jgi:hypothetical protein
VPELPKRAAALLLAEVRAAGSVDHPNVTVLYEVLEGVDEGPLLVSELLRGETLAQKLSRSPMLSVRETASLLLPVVSAVGTAHARGVVHGGLSTAGVFLWAGSGTVPAVKVLNFGVARWAAGVRGALGTARAGAGSATARPNSEYAPPELSLPDRVVDHRADIWALGILLYECLSGLRPPEFVPQEVDGAVTIPPIEQRAPSVPRALADIIAHLVVSDPDHRAQNLIELYNALSPLAEHVSPSFGWPGSERRISGLTQRASVLDVPATTPAPKLPEPPRTPWRMLALAAGGIAVLELVALTWLLGRSPDKEARAAQASASNAQAEMLSLQAAPPTTRPVLLDDFDDGDGVPFAPAFGNWQAFTVNPAGRALGLKLGAGHQSRGSVEMSWLLEHVLDGKFGPAGAGLRSLVRVGAVDLSGFGYVSFAHRFAPMNTPGLECKGVSEFVVFITCRALGQERAPQFELPIPVSDAWTSVSVDLRDLREVGGPLPRATNLKACLAATDSFGFRADATLAMESDGCDSGRLWLDDIAFR